MFRPINGISNFYQGQCYVISYVMLELVLSYVIAHSFFCSYCKNIPWTYSISTNLQQYLRQQDGISFSFNIINIFLFFVHCYFILFLLSYFFTKTYIVLMLTCIKHTPTRHLNYYDLLKYIQVSNHYCQLYWSAWATITNYNSLGSLNNRPYFVSVLEAESLRVWHSSDERSLPSLQMATCLLLYGKEREFPSIQSHRIPSLSLLPHLILFTAYKP